MDSGAWRATVHGVTERQDWSDWVPMHVFSTQTHFNRGPSGQMNWKMPPPPHNFPLTQGAGSSVQSGALPKPSSHLGSLSLLHPGWLLGRESVSFSSGLAAAGGKTAGPGLCSDTVGSVLGGTVSGGSLRLQTEGDLRNEGRSGYAAPDERPLQAVLWSPRHRLALRSYPWSRYTAGKTRVIDREPLQRGSLGVHFFNKYW